MDDRDAFVTRTDPRPQDRPDDLVALFIPEEQRADVIARFQRDAGNTEIDRGRHLTVRLPLVGSTRWCYDHAGPASPVRVVSSPGPGEMSRSKRYAGRS